jgi:hypothetical protein
VSCGYHEHAWGTGAVVTAVVLVLLGALVALGTALDVVRARARHAATGAAKRAGASAKPELATAGVKAGGGSGGSDPLYRPGGSVLEGLLRSFSLMHNAPRLFSITQHAHAPASGEAAHAATDLSAMHGARVMSLALVILGHTLFFGQNPGYFNMEAISPPSGALGTYAFQIIPSAEFAVGEWAALVQGEAACARRTDARLRALGVPAGTGLPRCGGTGTGADVRSWI